MKYALSILIVLYFVFGCISAWNHRHDASDREKMNARRKRVTEYTKHVIHLTAMGVGKEWSMDLAQQLDKIYIQLYVSSGECDRLLDVLKENLSYNTWLKNTGRIGTDFQFGVGEDTTMEGTAEHVK